MFGMLYSDKVAAGLLIKENRLQFKEYGIA